MFTGIVTHTGTAELRVAEAGGRLRVECPAGGAPARVGASIAVSGVCLSAAALDPAEEPKWFEADLSAETLARTASDRWRGGARVNLERALRVGDELGGHMVTGHVDAAIALLTRKREGESERFRFELPDRFAPLVAEKGSVAIDGVSLTVAAVAVGAFETVLIPHTLAVTALGDLAPGAKANLEVDTVSRYLARIVKPANAGV